MAHRSRGERGSAWAQELAGPRLSGVGKCGEARLGASRFTSVGWPGLHKLGRLGRFDRPWQPWGSWSTPTACIESLWRPENLVAVWRMRSIAALTWRPCHSSRTWHIDLQRRLQLGAAPGPTAVSLHWLLEATGMRFYCNRTDGSTTHWIHCEAGGHERVGTCYSQR